MNQRFHVFLLFCAIICSPRFSVSAQDSQAGVPPPEALELVPSQSRRVEEQGRGFIVTCRISQHFTGSNMQWMDAKTNSAVNNTGGRIHVTKPKNDKPGSTGLSMVFRNVTKEVEGLYLCVADIEGFEAEMAQKEFDLSVYTRINLDGVETVQTADVGKDYTLKCAVSGSPQPAIEWRRNQVALDSSGQTSSKYRVEPDGGLTIHNVSKADGGSYECEATQSVGNETSNFEQRAITLLVNYPPHFIDPAITTAYASLGGAVNLTCGAEGQPSPDYEWGLKENDQFAELPLSGVSSHTFLRMNITEPSQFRNYVCRARNPLGYVDRIFSVVQVERPPSPTLRLNRLDGNKVEFELEPPAMKSPLKIVGYRALVRPKDGHGVVAWENATKIDFNVDAEQEEFCRQKFVLSLMDALDEICCIRGKFHMNDSLYHGTDYEIRFAARNELGYGDYSDVRQVKTEVAHVSSASQSSGLLSIMVMLMMTSGFLRRTVLL